MDLEETSFLIWDLSNNCVVPNGTYDDLTNFDVSNQIITGSVFEFFALNTMQYLTKRQNLTFGLQLKFTTNNDTIRYKSGSRNNNKITAVAKNTYVYPTKETLSKIYFFKGHGRP